MFRRTRRDINIENSAAAGFGIPPPSVIRGALPSMAFPPPAPPVDRLVRPAARQDLLPHRAAPTPVPPCSSFHYFCLPLLSSPFLLVARLPIVAHSYFSNLMKKLFIEPAIN